MKILVCKTKRLFAFLFFLSVLNLNAFEMNNPFILSGEKIINLRANQKILEIGSELKQKTGVSVYIYLKHDYGIAKDISQRDKIKIIKTIESNIVNSLKPPFVLITLAYNQKHINLYTSKDLKNVIDKNDILDGYMIPILASRDKNSISSKITASILNGYSEIADRVAKYKNVKLEHNIEGSNKAMSDIWKKIMYFIVISGLVAYMIAVWRQKRLGIK